MSKKNFPPYHIYPGTIDSHTHLLHIAEKGLNLTEMLGQLEQSGFSYILDAGVHEGDFDRRLSLREKYPLLFYSAGIHPEGAEGDLDARLEKISLQLDNDLVLAVGEIGLDYYWKDRTPDIQKELFEKQLTLARKKKLPVIIHNREADDDCLNLLHRGSPDAGGVMHCFSSSKEFARKVLDLGFYISLAGNVTYKNAQNIQEAAAYVPLDRILIETDAPYLTPQKRRGRPNHPGHLGYTVDFLCELRDIPVEELTEHCRRNFKVLFNPPL